MALMKPFVRVLAFSLLVMLSGCMLQGVNKQDLIGKYCAKLPDGAVEYLELLPNGECIQEIVLKDKAPLIAHGTWRYSQERNYLSLMGTRIALGPFGNQINPNIEQVLSGHSGELSVSRSISGNVTIGLSEYTHYEKMEPTEKKP